MRLWSLHPKYLDARGLVALWREVLLAQAVLKGKTRGYTRHPQLLRFRESKEPVRAIAGYLLAVYDEASARGYNFDRAKIGRLGMDMKPIPVTQGQLRYEWKHLQEKLSQRSPEWLKTIRVTGSLEFHPLFRVVAGGIEKWEKIS